MLEKYFFGNLHLDRVLPFSVLWGGGVMINMSYRRIIKLLIKKGIKTHTGKEWGETGNSVYSVLKKYRQREERLELLNKEYELEWGTMEVKWEKN